MLKISAKIGDVILHAHFKSCFKSPCDLLERDKISKLTSSVEKESPNVYNLFFTLIEVLSPFVIQGNLASFLMFRLEKFLIGACLTILFIRRLKIDNQGL